MRLLRSLTTRISARHKLAFCTLLLGSTASGLVPTPSHAAPPAAGTTTAQNVDPNMLIATVNNDKITIRDVQRAAQSLPPQARQLPPQQILPLIVDQLIKQKAIQIAAEKEKLEDKPDVKAAMESAANNVLQNIYLEEKVSPKLTDAALKAYYQSHIASQKPETEIHARHILVDSEDKAKDIIAQLKKGSDFAKLAEHYSTDKGTASQNGGDLGWFKRDAMIPEFSQAAFAMKPGSYSQTPVHTQYGWHVIEVLGTREAHIPTFDEAKDSLRRDMLREEVSKVVDQALKQVKVVEYENNKPIPASSSAKKPAGQPAADGKSTDKH